MTSRMPTSQEKLPARVFFYRGLIERGRDYRHVPGYSEEGEHGPCYPWSTEREIRALGHRDGFRPIFRTEAA